MVYVPFGVVCGNCGHVNRGAHSPKEGARRMLSGAHRACTKCKSVWSEVHLTNRKLVLDTLAAMNREGVEKASHVVIEETQASHRTRAGAYGQAR